MKEKYCLVITTYADEENGKKIIDTLLSERLAACIQMMPIQSFYHWQGKIAHDQEKLLLIKSKAPLHPSDLQLYDRAVHSKTGHLFQDAKPDRACVRLLFYVSRQVPREDFQSSH